MRGGISGVQKRIQDVYPNAHYIHCYAHRLNLIMQQACRHIFKVRGFFANLTGFASFFHLSAKWMAVLTEVLNHRLPVTSNVRWDFRGRIVNTVFEHREDLIQCFKTICDSGDFDDTTVRATTGFVFLLEEEEFQFFLQLFHNIMPHVDILYAQLQKRSIDSVHIRWSIQQFQHQLEAIRDTLHSPPEQSSGSQPPGAHLLPEQSSGSGAKRRRTATSREELHQIAAEVCNTILGHSRERFPSHNTLSVPPCCRATSLKPTRWLFGGTEHHLEGLPNAQWKYAEDRT
ncbi:zinc finger MYM-type protein 1-like [Epinephelus fuscoguttatus]|uniref:zinc finger MYM-type protein 1-like n=1 Tax=Epinephelus fuscoguttatus TaxID=293821 RepID=UPI0020D03904|nr:zinc finger MYM-type protein 1-like [Epinephelus fuscoguttatus]